MNNYNEYFANRSVASELYDDYRLPPWLLSSLPSNKDGFILDIGCGLGQTLRELKAMGYNNAMGIDLSHEAVLEARSKKLNVEEIVSISDYADSSNQRFDFIIMSHILEHLKKEEIINTLSIIKNRLLKKGGTLYIATPNAQSPVGCYWSFEDFTHQTIFTSGSITYVLKAAGFNEILFLDSMNIEYKRGIKKYFILLMEKIYLANYKFWMKVVGASFHKTSSVILTWELKLIAK